MDQGGAAEHHNKKFEQITYEGRHLEGRIFRNCTFYKCSLKSCVFEESNFEKCTFEDCDLSLMKFKDVFLSNVSLVNCKAIGVVWADANNPFTISFTDTRLSYGIFSGKNLKKAQFINCIADEADFSECNLSQSDFSGTDLHAARFYNTDLTKANFATAKNYFIDTKTNRLLKAKFSLPEALSFLHGLGIELVE